MRYLMILFKRLKRGRSSRRIRRYKPISPKGAAMMNGTRQPQAAIASSDNAALNR